jgi:hypothetical protein
VEGTGTLVPAEDTAGGGLLLPGLLGEDGGETDVGRVFAALDTGCLADVDVGTTRAVELVPAAVDVGAAAAVDEGCGRADDAPFG